MLAFWLGLGIVFFLTLAVFVLMRYRAARTRGELPQYRDLDELNEVVNGILKRERAKAGRERAQLSRDSEKSGRDVPGLTAPTDIGPLGGIVRSQSYTDAGTTTATSTDTRRPRRA